MRLNLTRVAGALLLPLLIGGCDLQNPTVITEDEADPRLLVNGALTAWNGAIVSVIEMEFLVSDEAHYSGPSTFLANMDAAGDLALDLGYQYQYTAMSEARELMRVAIERARPLNNETALYRALTYRGWFLLETARRWGDQPIMGGGKKLSQAEIYALAVEHFAEVEQASGPAADSMRHRALAGIAWAGWTMGREGADRPLLERAIGAAEEVLTQEPEFVFIIPGQYNGLAYPVRNGNYVPNPDFEDIPFWWLDPSGPQGTQYANATGLRLIQADALLRLQDLEAAKDIIEAEPLLRVNHIGLAGRDPAGDPLTDAEAAAFIDPLDPEGLQFVIDELQRENWYTHGRRNVGPQGPIFPVALPKSVY
jgi:hypothetical protein